MAKIRLNPMVSEKDINKMLQEYGIAELVEQLANDPFVSSAYEHLKLLHEHHYQLKMPLVNQRRKSEFFKSYEDFQKRFYQYLKRSFAELILEEYAINRDPARTKKQIDKKARQFFEQRLGMATEEVTSQLKYDKLLNGEQTSPWLS